MDPRGPLTLCSQLCLLFLLNLPDVKNLPVFSDNSCGFFHSTVVCRHDGGLPALWSEMWMVPHLQDSQCQPLWTPPEFGIYSTIFHLWIDSVHVVLGLNFCPIPPCLCLANSCQSFNVLKSFLWPKNTELAPFACPPILSNTFVCLYCSSVVLKLEHASESILLFVKTKTAGPQTRVSG